MIGLAALLDGAVQGGVAPGLSAVVLRRGRLVEAAAAGSARITTWFDLASLTKPLATGLGALRLAQLGALALDAPVVRYLPAFARAGKGEVEVQDLLDHSSGLPAWRPYFRAVADDPIAAPIFRGAGAPAAFERGRELVASGVDEEPLAAARRSATLYSDLGFLALGRLLAAAAGAPLDATVQREVFERLGVRDIGFFDLARGGVPAALDLAATGTSRPREPAPGQEEALAGLGRTEVGPRPGEVDDDNAYACGGVAGHAGLFGTAAAVAALGQAFLEEVHGAGKLASRELARRFATPRPGSTRGLAWDRPEPGGSLGSRPGQGALGAVGHLGFTGGSLWIDLDAQLVVALLSNRTLLGRANQKIRAFRPRFHDAVAAALEIAPQAGGT
ncbi:MAG: serine hydrolase domain-containing protein [Myxococcales bacterium]